MFGIFLWIYPLGLDGTFKSVTSTHMHTVIEITETLVVWCKRDQKEMIMF